MPVASATTAKALRGTVRAATPVWVGLAICLPLAIVQILWCGYQFGVGNQGIQVALLKLAIDPGLFPRDVMIQMTHSAYATWFFTALAPLARLTGIEPLYLMLHVLTTFGVLAATYSLSRAVTKSHLSALLALGLLLAGHHRALAGEMLYSTGFTHTYAALALALVVMGLYYRGWIVWAFLATGVLFDVHALTGTYVGVMLIAAAIGEWLPRRGRTGTAQPNRRVWVGMALGLLCALPTLAIMATHAGRGSFDAAWINLMRIRSADHSFASSWWVGGDPDIPRFTLLLALFALSLSFAVRSRAMRITRWMTLGVLLLFAAGYVFTEVWPMAWAVRLQPFRASRLLEVLMFIHIAHAGAEGLKMLNRRGVLPLGARLLEAGCAVIVLATLAVPAFLSFLPLAVLVMLAVALVTGRLAWWQAVVGTGALLLAFVAYQKIGYSLPGFSRDLSLAPGVWSDDPLLRGMIAATVAVGLLGRHVRKHRALKVFLLLGAFIAGGMGTGFLFAREFDRGVWADPLVRVAAWARQDTPHDALFLTPANVANFRMFSQRSVVGNWRDGTQMYFSGPFAPEWFGQMNAIEPGIVVSPDGRRLISRGKSLDTLDDDALIALAKSCHANYILLPTPPLHAPPKHRTLQCDYRNDEWSIFEPVISARAKAAAPVGVIDPDAWQEMESFMSTTVATNIEKNRKADVTIQILDTTGRPVQDLALDFVQQRHAFLFGASLGFFEPNSTDALGDQKANPVTPEERRLFPELFNASMIPFSAKWMYLEPVEGHPDYSDLDQYVAYAQEHGTALEFHFLAGLIPGWARKDASKQAKDFPDHARQLMERYHDRIKFWQVTNDKILLKETPPLFKEFHANYPDIKLGLSDCTRFWSNKKSPGREAEMYKGFDGLVWLKQQGVQPDFFSIHGHYPVGLWTDPREMYEVLDRYAAQGVKVHISEMLLPLGTEIAGPVRKGKWTEELQAEFYERYLAVCFSHPAVEMVNLWGMSATGWGAGSGVLDKSQKPRLAWDRLRLLWQKTWHTELHTTLPLDGTVKVRAFHGQYALTVRLADGRLARQILTVPETTSAAFRLRLNRETGMISLEN